MNVSRTFQPNFHRHIFHRRNVENRKEYFYDNFLEHRASLGIDFTRKPEKQTRVHYFGETMLVRLKVYGEENRKEINELF